MCMCMNLRVLYMYTFFHGNRVDFREAIESTDPTTSPFQYVSAIMCVYVCCCMCVCVYVCVYMCISVHMYVHVYIYYIYIYSLHAFTYSFVKIASITISHLSSSKRAHIYIYYMYIYSLHAFTITCIYVFVRENRVDYRLSPLLL